MDSLKVKFSAVRPDRNTIVMDSMRVAALPAGGKVEFEYTFNTLEKELEGDVSLVVEINPDNDQPEQYTFNNTYIQPFHVLIDKLNPLLDVTFDGKRIIDGDIIAPRPEILIQVNDENAYIPMNDTSNFEVYFYESRPGEGPNSNNRVAINSNPLIEWRPASLPENKAEVLFRPGFIEALEDGEYVLNVQGKDQKGNSSGNDTYYQISFKVVNEATITHVVNYPNPFSTSTRFVYTLTGQDIPTKFQIHIYTVAGKLVKAIDLLAEGDVAIGQNITNYAWDGTDQYGDPLGNGVYLYRVILESPGDTHSLRDEGTSQYFNKGWGKMYLMR
jgi:flagellar hook assembly protein FlgD